MTILLDTQILLWTAGVNDRLPAEAIVMTSNPANDLVFSVASLWEVTIKNSLQREDFSVDPHLLRRSLLDHGYKELSITGTHALALDLLPNIHRDPFDRILVAQAQIERMTLLTTDATLGKYPGPIRVLG
ncbi:MAG: type II toxin-antitoxin system VapC family toxin [Gemmatimonadetes bacterium]|nr:type II toxin-antitoxin system VapC family toxin [Gemmatimonadota bacterium]